VVHIHAFVFVVHIYGIDREVVRIGMMLCAGCSDTTGVVAPSHLRHPSTRPYREESPLSFPRSLPCLSSFSSSMNSNTNLV
jgi:hypothetical protein